MKKTLIAIVLLTSSALAKPVQLNLNGVDIKTFTQTVSKLTGKNFILPKNFNGKVSIISSKPISERKLYQIFTAVLDELGYQAVDHGSYIKILPKREAYSQAPVDSLKAGSEEIGTYIFFPKVDALLFSRLIRNLLSPSARVSALPKLNVLIVTDTKSNVQKVRTLLRAINQIEPNVQIKSFKLKNAKASDVERVLKGLLLKTYAQELSGAFPIPGRQYFHMASDDRTNTLFVIGTDGVLKKISDLIKSLDQPNVAGGGFIHVVKLNYAFSSDLADVLSKLFSGKLSKAVSGPVKIVADKPTNSLIVLASPDDFKLIKNVIKQLDVRRPQVFVQAQIVEMSMDKFMQLGFEWKFLSRGATVPFGGTSFGTLPVGEGYPNITTGGLFVGLAKWRNGVPDIGALLSAYAKEGGVNIIATPQILTLDNEEADINISKRIPFSTGVKYDANNNPVITYNYRDVGIELKITPHITASGTVRLKVYEKVEDITGYANADQTTPITSKREARTVVDVDDGQTLVIGGLMKTRKVVTLEKVPLLGDLPVLGFLFRRKSYTYEKVNLLVFITPKIVRNRSQEDDITRQSVGIYNRAVEDMKRENSGILRDLKQNLEPQRIEFEEKANKTAEK